MSDYDSPWKEALDRFLPAFLAFFFPRVHAIIDWSHEYKSQDTELQKLTQGAKIGPRDADRLFQVWRRNGEEVWIIVHVEVQGRREDRFGERMFVYNYRGYDKFDRPVVSLAVLTDEHPNWRPSRFGYSLGGCTMNLEFPVVKLLDYRELLPLLETHPNPFAPVVVANLKNLETRHDPTARRAWKFRVIRSLYERGLTAEDVRQLFRLIDWMMDLPQELDEQLWQELSQFEKEKNMPYVTSVERLALKKGRAEGRVEGAAATLIHILERRFPGQVPADLNTAIQGTSDLAQLERWVDLALEVASVADFRQMSQL